MKRLRSFELVLVLLLVVVLSLAACYGAMKSSPDNPTSVGGLTPNVEDKDVGPVAVAPGFNITKYKVVVVQKFPVTDPSVKDEGDRRFAAKMAPILHIELMRRLKDSGLFAQVVDPSAGPLTPGAEPVLRLEGAITRLGRGSQAARAFAGAYGAGRARAQADMHFVDVSSGRVVLVTADRRIAQMGLIGGSDEELLEESFNDMARDLAKFLLRLSKGEAPKKD